MLHSRRGRKENLLLPTPPHLSHIQCRFTQQQHAGTMQGNPFLPVIDGWGCISSLTPTMSVVTQEPTSEELKEPRLDQAETGGSHYWHTPQPAISCSSYTPNWMQKESVHICHPNPDYAYPVCNVYGKCHTHTLRHGHAPTHTHVQARHGKKGTPTSRQDLSLIFFWRPQSCHGTSTCF